MKGPRDPQPRSAQGGASSQAPADFVVQFSKVVSSSLGSDETQATLYNIAGIAGFDFSGAEPALSTDDEDGEGIEGADVYGALGILARPLPPETKRGREEFAEVVCLRTVDGLVPIAVRDLRIKMQGDGPSEGTTALAGYGGGFHSLTPVADGTDPDGGGTIHVLYCPFDFDSAGVAQKAHSVILDPTPGNESIIMAHADGQAITMFEGRTVLKSPDGSSYLNIEDGAVDLVTGTLTINAGVVVGDAATAVPLLAGAASPPSSKFFVSP